MRATIKHLIRFNYSRAVFIDPQTVRLQPRSDAHQRTENFRLLVRPSPAGLTECVDLEGNTTASLWFDGLHSGLELTAVSQVETLQTNPFDYIISTANAETLPMEYPRPLRDLLRPYGIRHDPSSEVDRFARDLLAQVNGHTIPFLQRICELINRDFDRVIRDSGDAFPPEHTLRERKGACRDFAVLAMDACRSLGIAVRFVSGYLIIDKPRERRDLHAWFEAYLPGGGWRGFDPALGLATADRHVAVASCAVPGGASPTEGTFRGTGIESRLDYDVSIQEGWQDTFDGAIQRQQQDKDDRSHP